MSFTELQVIHRHVKQSPSGASATSTQKAAPSSRLFLLPQTHDYDQDDLGLVMKIDGKVSKDTTTIMRGTVNSPSSSAPSPSAVRPSAVSSQLCGQGHEVTGWVLRGALFLQTAHIPFIKLTHKMNETIQRKAKLLMPLVFYMSLLVLVAQIMAVVMLFTQSFMPLGMWFLLACIAILAAMFCYTAIRGNPHHKKSQPLSPTKSIAAELKLL